jgi:hypothetical protein
MRLVMYCSYMTFFQSFCFENRSMSRSRVGFYSTLSLYQIHQVGKQNLTLQRHRL